MKEHKWPWTIWMKRDECGLCDAEGYVRCWSHHWQCDGATCEQYGCPVLGLDLCEEPIHFTNFQKVL